MSAPTPRQFIEQAAEIINRCKPMALADGIRCQRLGDDAVWAQVPPRNWPAV